MSNNTVFSKHKLKFIMKKIKDKDLAGADQIGITKNGNIAVTRVATVKKYDNAGDYYGSVLKQNTKYYPRTSPNVNLIKKHGLLPDYDNRKK